MLAYYKPAHSFKPDESANPENRKRRGKEKVL